MVVYRVQSKYHRLIGTVLVGVDPINRIMVKNGMAWA
ncbi:thermonuclease family protein, partial [Acinetobacter baumannii]